MRNIDRFHQISDIYEVFEDGSITVTVQTSNILVGSSVVISVGFYDGDEDPVPASINQTEYIRQAVVSMQDLILETATRLAEADATEAAIRAKEEAEAILRIVSDNEKAASAATVNGH